MAWALCSAVLCPVERERCRFCPLPADRSLMCQWKNIGAMEIVEQPPTPCDEIILVPSNWQSETVPSKPF